MPRIYSEASNVCIWLGIGDESSSLAVELVQKIAAENNFFKFIELDITPAHWLAFTQLMKSSWFRRRWVIQEIGLANRATIHCGTDSCSWENFSYAVAPYRIEEDDVRLKLQSDPSSRVRLDSLNEVPASQLLEVVETLVLRGHDGRVVHKTLTLEALVARLIPFHVGRPQDIIYAVLSLASDVVGFSTVTQVTERHTRIYQD